MLDAVRHPLRRAARAAHVTVHEVVLQWVVGVGAAYGVHSDLLLTVAMWRFQRQLWPIGTIGKNILAI
jgi:hypothetical protein